MSTQAPVIQRVTLRTRDAGRLAAFYRDTLGLRPESTASGLDLVFSDRPLLTLIEDRAAVNAPAGAPGLFHVAFLFPELSGWSTAMQRTLRAGAPLHGASDHAVSWAGYFADPDGNGLELAWDTPRAEWPWEGDQIRMVTRALPLRSILAQTPGDLAEFGAVEVGHVHLQVSDLASASEYCAQLDLRVTQDNYPGARFLARGDYHHHVAVNTWRTAPGVVRPENAVGLVGWEMRRGAAAVPSPWRDPAGNAVEFSA